MLKKDENALHPRTQLKTGHICVDSTKFSSFIKALPVMCSIARQHFYFRGTQFVDQTGLLWFVGVCTKALYERVKGAFLSTLLPQTNRGSSIKKAPFERHRGWVEFFLFFLLPLPHIFLYSDHTLRSEFTSSPASAAKVTGTG